MIDIKNWVSEQISNPERIALPIMTHPGIEMIGRKVREAVQDGEVHAMAIKKLNEIYPTAATTVIMDLTVETEAFGAPIEFQEDEMPHLLGRLVSSAEEIEALKVPDLSAGRIPQYLKANRLTVEATRNKPVFASVIGPFSLAGRLYDMSEIMVACYTEPQAIHALLEKCTEFILNYCKELKRIGCSGVVVAEPAAGLLSNEDCQDFSSEYIKKIVDTLQDEHFLVILHNCGNQGHCTEAMLYTGANALHFGNAIDMAEALRSCPKDKLIMGNVDPVGVLKLLSPAEVKAYVQDLLNKTQDFDNFILSTGCDLPPLVPTANIAAFFDALRDFNKSRVLQELDAYPK
ncbi:MAG: uroporphyrinogen decarboxylase family protein [Prolixibacteraceae bacterium]|jgi:uroporphyrinogen decarboxylase|nr:uroporphyrinogen decarboxylase family protein [Prolixibacteraceae bacterium]